MLKLHHSEMTSIAGAMSAIGASLTLEQAGIIVGIVTALVTCAFNVLYMIRRDAREQRMADLKLGAIHEHE